MGFGMDKLCYSHSQGRAMFFFLPCFSSCEKKKDRPVKSKSSSFSFSPSFPPFTCLRPYAVVDFWLLGFLPCHSTPFFFLRLKGSFSPIKVNNSLDIGLK